MNPFITEYIAAKKKDPPKADHIVQLYEKVFLDRMSRCKDKNDVYDIVWFLKYVASVVSHQTEVGKRTKLVNYRENVTQTDEAFALMALEYHKSKWKNKETTSNGSQGEKEKRKRVTGAATSESRQYYTKMTKKMGDIRKNKAEKYSNGERWLQDEMSKLLGEGAKQVAQPKEVIDVSVVDSGVSLEMEMNPFLDGGEVEVV